MTKKLFIEFATLFFIASQTCDAQTGFAVRMDNPVDCTKSRKNLVVETSAGFPRTEFYTCDPDGKADLAAIIEYGRKTDGGAELYGFVYSKAEAKNFAKLYPGIKFLSPDDRLGRAYAVQFNRLIKKLLQNRI
ncbi:MAG: hypothetical protein P4L79_07860 [Legionella sp.]|uniref:hypothetical protein n=1 Tax=Legionella sp. TaxID=459 RepID=UPI00283D4873|nr:hypothetical protein [Legionella sp.]